LLNNGITMSETPADKTPVRASTAARLTPLGAARAGATGGALQPLKRRRRWWLWLVLALLLAAGIAFMALNKRTEVQAASVLSAFPSAQYAQLTASGYVVAQRRAAVSSKASGRLVELLVREGSAVKAGDLIGKLDAADVQATAQAAQAGVAQAQAGVAQARAGVASTQVELGNAESELKRNLTLQEQGFVSAQAIDTARRRVDAARAAMAAAQAGIATASGGRELANAQVQVQRVNRNNTEIRAPFDGVVLVKNANVGDMITPFSSAGGTQGAVVTMADMSTLEVEADVSESNVGKVKIDMPVEIVLDALPEQRFRGTVARIVPTVDRAKATVMTKVRFEALDPRILPEMSAKVVFLTQRPADADFKPVTAVNPKAVAEREGKKFVFRIKGTGDAMVAEAVPITPGRTLGDALEVTGSTLKAGDRLVMSPSAQLADGAKISVAGK
jgi:HlyD family secretion protein